MKNKAMKTKTARRWINKNAWHIADKKQESNKGFARRLKMCRTVLWLSEGRG